MPPVISLCQQALLRHNPTARILTPEYWTTEYVGDIPADLILSQTHEQQSNILRAHLLLQFGGLWLDADFVTLRSLEGLAPLVDGGTFLAYPQCEQICSALIGCNAGHPVAVEYWRRIREYLVGGKKIVRWEIGPNMLRASMAACGWRDVVLLPTCEVHPLHWKDPKKISDGATVDFSSMWGFMFTHDSDFGAQTADEILAGKSTIAAALRYSFGIA